ncbi:MAG: T9SS type A sorting domain-containing protein [Bacteroidota bacterium]
MGNFQRYCISCLLLFCCFSGALYAGNANFMYPNSQYCENDPVNPLPIILGDSGGVFSSNPFTAALNPLTGEIDLAMIASGNFNITYTLQSPCSTAFTLTITIGQVYSPQVHYGAQPDYCAGGLAVGPMFFSPVFGGNFYAATPGLVVDSVSGAVDLAISAPGMHLVAYCAGDSWCLNCDTTEFNIIALDTVTSLNYPDDTICMDGVNVSPIIMGDSGGTFLSNPGLNYADTLGTIDLSNTAPGQHIIRYLLPGMCGTILEDTVQLIPAPMALITLNGNTLTAPSGPYDYQWYLNGIPIPSANDSTFVPVVNGTYSVTMTVPTGQCPSSDTLDLNVAIDDPLAGQYALHPNPSTGQFRLHLESALELANLQVMDLKGRVLSPDAYGLPGTGQDRVIDLGRQPDGLYLLRIQTPESATTVKMMKY